MLSKALIDLRSGLALYKVWVYQAYHELSSKYKRTFLGSLWIAGSMVATSLSISLVFGGLFGESIQKSLPFMMGGILVYTMTSFILTDAAEIFIASSGIIKNHAYPFTYYILEAVARSFIVFGHNIVVFFILVTLLGSFRIPDWTLVPGVVLVLLAMGFWGTIVAMLSARFRDLRFLMPYLSQLLFFLTPIFWHVDKLSGPRALVVYFNPFYGLVEVIRSPLLGHAAPLNCWVSACLTVSIGAIAWLIVFSPLRRRIPFWI